MRKAKFNLLRIEEELSIAHLRLSRVYIENMHYEKLIERYDKPHTLFYIDPPYYGMENYYGKGIFHRSDFQKLKDLLKGIKGKFIMSINNVKEIQDLFKGFHIEKVTTTYSVCNTRKTKAVELLIMNFKPSVNLTLNPKKRT